jgi:hypothetical protein
MYDTITLQQVLKESYVVNTTGQGSKVSPGPDTSWRTSRLSRIMELFSLDFIDIMKRKTPDTE